MPQSSYRDIVLMRGAKEIREASSRLKLPSEVVEGALGCLSRALDMGLTKALGHACVRPLCLYVSARLVGVPITLSQVLSSFKHGCRRPYSALLRLSRELGVKLKPMSPEGLLVGACRELSLPPSVEAVALEELSKLKRLMGGRSPRTIAALALINAARRAGVKVPASRAAKALGLTAAALRSARRDLHKLGRRAPLPPELAPIGYELGEEA